VVGDTMYVVTPYPNLVLAFDLSKPGANLKWKFDPHTQASAQGVACCDVVNRGAAYADKRVFFNTLDNNTIALDAETGRELWRTPMGDIQHGQTITMAPLVVKGKVLVGNSGGEMGVRGWLSALDAATGKQLWRAYHTGPDADVLIGASFKPYYEQDRGTDLGVKSWPSEAWKIGGGNAWGWVSYDPALDLIYYGTGNPGPWNPEQRPGANKWTAGIFARKPDSGEAVWFYQWSPHDLHDYDGVNENVLLDLPVAGAARKVLLHADRNGYVYVLDRASGQVLSPTPSCTSPRRSAWTCRPGVALQPGEGAQHHQGDARHLPRVARRQGLAADGVVAAHASCSTSRTRTSARTPSSRRRATSPARPTWAPTPR
jgi:PQQ-dependent dehydrogenase (methanol/ethanol family)